MIDAVIKIKNHKMYRSNNSFKFPKSVCLQIVVPGPRDIIISKNLKTFDKGQERPEIH